MATHQLRHALDRRGVPLHLLGGSRRNPEVKRAARTSEGDDEHSVRAFQSCARGNHALVDIAP